MNLYLSEAGANDKDLASYKEAKELVLNTCIENNIHCWRSEAFSSYEEIEAIINNSEIFIALVSDYWLSSTWKCIEYTYSGGGPGQIDKEGGVIVQNRIAYLIGNIEFPKALSGDPATINIVNTCRELKIALEKSVINQK